MTISTVAEAYNNYTFRKGMMQCGVALKSISKGLECIDYNSCDVSYKGYRKEGRKAECGCFYDESGYPKCGAMNGDSEFDEYRAAFVKFFSKTKYCHVARDFDFDCGAKPEFYKL